MTSSVAYMYQLYPELRPGGNPRAKRSQNDVAHINRELRSGDHVRHQSLTDYKDLNRYRNKYGLRNLSSIISDAAAHSMEPSGKTTISRRRTDDDELISAGGRTETTGEWNDAVHAAPFTKQHGLPADNPAQPNLDNLSAKDRNELWDQPSLAARIPAEWKPASRYTEPNAVSAITDETPRCRSALSSYDLKDQPSLAARIPSDWNPPARYSNQPQDAPGMPDNISTKLPATERSMDDLFDQPMITARIPAEWNGPVRYSRPRPASMIEVDDYDYLLPQVEAANTQSFRRPAAEDWAVRDSNKLLDATDHYLGETSILAACSEIDTEPVRNTLQPLTEQNDFRCHSAMSSVPAREPSRTLRTRTWRNY